MSAKKEKERIWNGTQRPATDVGDWNLKGAKFNQVSHPVTRRVAAIKLRKSDAKFWTVVGTEYFESESASEVENWALEQMGKSTSIEWQPVIELRDNSSEHWRDDGEIRAEIDFFLERYWIGRTEGGSWRKLEWDQADPQSPFALADGQKVARSQAFDEFSPDNARRRRRNKGVTDVAYELPVKIDDRVFLPYDLDLWVGMLGVVEMIRSSRRRLGEILANIAGLDALRTWARGQMPALPLLLPAGEADAEKIRTAEGERYATDADLEEEGDEEFESDDPPYEEDQENE
jgi:hypothetical protein